MKPVIGVGSALRGPMLVVAVTIVACFGLMSAISVAEAGHGGGGHGGGGGGHFAGGSHFAAGSGSRSFSQGGHGGHFATGSYGGILLVVLSAGTTPITVPEITAIRAVGTTPIAA